MTDYQPKEQYILEPQILTEIDFEYVEKQINQSLIFSLKNLKEANFAQIIFMTKEEFEIITVKINPLKILS